jgi:hypothetical protein
MPSGGRKQRVVLNFMPVNELKQWVARVRAR